MSTENDATAPLPTGAHRDDRHDDRQSDRHGDRRGDQPTMPIRRSANARTNDPTLVFETFGGQSVEQQSGEQQSGEQPFDEDGPAAPTRAIPVDGAGAGRTPTGSTPTGDVPPTVPGSGSTAVPGPDDRDGNREPRPSLRVGTVVWGLVIALIGAGLIAIASGARFDLELAFIGLLALAGVGLVVGSVVTGTRRRR